jgi:hypothetical protein
MEREALGVKEALIHCQPFIEGEQNMVITDHTVLQWAQTYENANCCLVVWGAVFGVYPCLEIVHRAGVVHLNVDPLSRLKRIPPHQSPVKDNMLSLPEQPPDQPLVAWQSQLDKIPAEKVSFITTRSGKTWSSSNSPRTPTKFMTPLSTEQEMHKAAADKGKMSNPPSKDFQLTTLSISISPMHLESFIKGYQEDLHFKKIWDSTNTDPLELKAAQ